MNSNNYRLLTSDEVVALSALGNRAEDWSRIRVSDAFNTNALVRNTLMGDVFIGAIADATIADGTLTLPEGISNSMLCNCTIGDHCAIHNVHMLSGYTIGNGCILFNIDEMTAGGDKHPCIEPMNENGGRRIIPFNGMTIGDAYLWARFRGQGHLLERLEAMTRLQLNYGTVGDCCIIKNSKCLRNVAVRSSADDRSRIEECIMLSDGVVGYGCSLEYGIIAQRFLLGEHVHLEYGLRLNDSVVGDNSTLARCEVGCSIIFPAHEQHHNNSFLIASLVMGQSNVAAGGTLGSNHICRSAHGEICAGRGFWPGLCVSRNHSSRFASYCLLAKADYPAELNITLPFALVNNNVAKNQLEVMPAYWWLYNMYAMDRNSKKFAQRDKRVYKAQHIEFDNLAPDTAEEIIIGRDLLRIWTEVAYRNQGGTHTNMSAVNPKLEILAHGMEKGKRKTVILKAGEGYKAYFDMLVYYAMKTLEPLYGDRLPESALGNGERITRWVNIGGQLIAENDMQQIISDIENGTLGNWDDIHSRFDALWEAYPAAKQRHAYQVLCYLVQKKSLDSTEWIRFRAEYGRICQYVVDQKALSRKKDDANEFRHMTYWNDAEMHAVLD